MKKKIISIVTAGVLAGTMLVGCGGSNEAATTSASSKKAEVKEEVKDASVEKIVEEVDSTGLYTLTADDIKEISKDLGSAVYKDQTMDEGIEGVSAEAVSLTDEEIQKIKDMNLEIGVEFGANGDTYKWMNAGIDEACEALGITVKDTWYSTDQANLTQLEDYMKILSVANNYDAFVTLPMDAASQSEVLLQIQDIIPVEYMSTAPFNADWNAENFCGVTDVDAYKAGQMTAKAAVKILGETGGKIGTVGYINGHEGSLLTCKLRYDGWDDVLGENGIEPVEVWYDNPEEAKPVIQSMLSANPDINVLLVDWSGYAGNQALQVIKEMGLTGRDIKIVCIDLDDTTAIPMGEDADSPSAALVAQPWYAVGRDCIYQMAYHFLYPDKTPKFIASTPEPVATHYNIKNVYKNSVPASYDIPETITNLDDQWDEAEYK